MTPVHVLADEEQMNAARTKRYEAGKHTGIREKKEARLKSKRSYSRRRW